MAKKIEPKTDIKTEKEYVIPLRNKWKRVPRYKKTNKAIKAIKEFLVKHMRIRDRDLNKIKIDTYLNEEIWFRGIKKPPAKIKVKAIKEGDIVRVELAEMPAKLKFKKLREEKREKKSADIVKEKTKKLEEKAKEKAKSDADKKKAEESPEAKKAASDADKPLGMPKNTELEGKDKKEETKKEEAKEKKSAVVESTQKLEKELAKKTKHEIGGKTKQPKHQIRKALAK